MRRLQLVEIVRPGHLLPVIGVLAAVLVPLGVAFSMGPIPSSDGTIQGCFRTHQNSNEVQGQLRVVSDPSLCKENESPLSWQQSAGSDTPDGAGAVLFSNRIRLPAGAGDTRFSIGSTTCGSELGCQIAAPRDGTLANLFVVAESPPAADSVVTVTAVVNGMDTALSLTHAEADGSGVKGNTGDTVDINQGDLVTLKFSGTGGPSTSTPFYRASFELR